MLIDIALAILTVLFFLFIFQENRDVRKNEMHTSNGKCLIEKRVLILVAIMAFLSLFMLILFVLDEDAEYKWNVLVNTLKLLTLVSLSVYFLLGFVRIIFQSQLSNSASQMLKQHGVQRVMEV